MDHGVKMELINALNAFRVAANDLSDKWQRAQDETSEQLGTTGYPFEPSFDGVTEDISVWVEKFLNELNPLASGKIPDLICCQECEGTGRTEDGKCDHCWGTGLVSEDVEVDENRADDIPTSAVTTPNTFTNSKAYLDWVKSEAENRIYDDLAKHGEPENITVTFYGRTLVIDTNADNYESFCSFLSEVVKNDNE